MELTADVWQSISVLTPPEQRVGRNRKQRYIREYPISGGIRRRHSRATDNLLPSSTSVSHRPVRQMHHAVTCRPRYTYRSSLKHSSMDAVHEATSLCLVADR